jgi:hypothetical protein
MQVLFLKMSNIFRLVSFSGETIPVGYREGLTFEKEEPFLKKGFALLLAAMLALFCLAGCGTTNKTPAANNSGTSSADHSKDVVTGDKSDAATSPNQSSSAKSTVTGSNAAGQAYRGSASGSTPIGMAPPTTTTGTMTTHANNTVANRDNTIIPKQNTVLRPATYEQMLRNAHVHDTDGNLRDHENAVTPGTNS